MAVGVGVGVEAGMARHGCSLAVARRHSHTGSFDSKTFI